MLYGVYGVVWGDGPGDGDPWVMGQELNGPLGSWVTLSDPFPALVCSVTVTQSKVKVTSP